MGDELSKEPLRPSVFYAESAVRCRLQDAWRMMLDYKAWNPDFVHSETNSVRGEPGCEGELTLITQLDGNRTPVAQFYAETVKLVPPYHIVWYVFPKEGDAFRNFVDFWLEETSSGVKFRIYYYAQNSVGVQALAQLRTDIETSLRNLVMAFKSYCESRSSVSQSTS
jgi:hypothetical protein